MDMEVEQRRKKRAHNDSCLVDLPENCIFNILVRLPLKTLICSSRLVCKSWFEIINSPNFKNAHLRQSDTITRGLIFLTSVGNFSSPRKKVFSIKSKSKSKSKSMHVDQQKPLHIKFMEIKDGKGTIKECNTTFSGKIVATCNGLIVLENNAGTRLIILNPVTRELEDIPLGTKSSLQRDSYGLAFCHKSRRYKLLHLFTKDKFGCEIIDIGSGSWRAVDVPPTQSFNFLQHPIFAMGALHWIQYTVDCGPCMVSMPLDDEKFKTMAIPEIDGSYFHVNLIFAMGEFLGFAGRLELGNPLIGVWILRGLGGECGWEKQYNIDAASGLGNLTTLLCLYGGDNGRHASFIFKCAKDGCLYAYDDRHSQHMRNIGDNVVDSLVSWSIFPHVNSLVSWRS